MAIASPPTAIAELRRWLVRMETPGREDSAVLPFGVPEVDQHLPDGGLTLKHDRKFRTNLRTTIRT